MMPSKSSGYRCASASPCLGCGCGRRDRYEQQRNEMALPLYEYDTQRASMEAPPPEMQQLFAALQGNQEQTNRFFGLVEGTTSFSEFFSPENIQRIMVAAGVGAAPTKPTG